MKLSKSKIEVFRKEINDYYQLNARTFPWRNTRDPYKILISEVMLQQTQVARVLIKYKEFLTNFPTIHSLARAPLKKLLLVWQGLGYNRRALYLHKSAKIITSDYKGQFPQDQKVLQQLPGIGQSTAGAIVAFSFNKPSIFIETNIRRVFIHTFFSREKNINDKKIVGLIELTFDRKNPREWYYALMDYGAMLSGKVENPNRRSSQYSKQSRFEGSDRQIRSAILRQILKAKKSQRTILRESKYDKEKVKEILMALQKEGFIAMSKDVYYVS